VSGHGVDDECAVLWLEVSIGSGSGKRAASKGVSAPASPRPTVVGPPMVWWSGSRAARGRPVVVNAERGFPRQFDAMPRCAGLVLV
jgi:hypothetical protein